MKPDLLITYVFILKRIRWTLDCVFSMSLSAEYNNLIIFDNNIMTLTIYYIYICVRGSEYVTKNEGQEYSP